LGEPFRRPQEHQTRELRRAIEAKNQANALLMEARSEAELAAMGR